MDSLLDINNLSFNDSKITIILDDKGEPWFKAKDVCNILEYKNSNETVTKFVKEKYKRAVVNIKGSETLPFSISSQTIFINEAGLYQLIMKSKLPVTEQFQDWVFEEVLPSIRKHGEYKLKQSLELKEKEIKDLSNNFKDQLSIKDNELSQKDKKLKSQKTNNKNFICN